MTVARAPLFVLPCLGAQCSHSAVLGSVQYNSISFEMVRLPQSTVTHQVARPRLAGRVAIDRFRRVLSLTYPKWALRGRGYR